MASARVRSDDSTRFTSVELLKYKSISEVFLSSTFLQGQQQRPDVPKSQPAKQPSLFSGVKLHCGTGRMWFVVTEE